MFIHIKVKNFTVRGEYEMIPYGKEKICLIVSFILILSLFTYIITNLSSTSNSSSNPINSAFYCLDKIIFLDKTPDEMSRISQNDAIYSIAQSVIEKK